MGWMLILASCVAVLIEVQQPIARRHLQYCVWVLWVVDNGVMPERRSKCCGRSEVNLAQGNATCSSCWH